MIVLIKPVNYAIICMDKWPQIGCLCCKSRLTMYALHSSFVLLHTWAVIFTDAKKPSSLGCSPKLAITCYILTWSKQTKCCCVGLFDDEIENIVAVCASNNFVAGRSPAVRFSETWQCTVNVVQVFRSCFRLFCQCTVHRYRKVVWVCVEVWLNVYFFSPIWDNSLAVITLFV